MRTTCPAPASQAPQIDTYSAPSGPTATPAGKISPLLATIVREPLGATRTNAPVGSPDSSELACVPYYTINQIAFILELRMNFC